MAAHLEGKGCGMIDMAGLAQKGGAVFSHVKLARAPEDIHAIRVAAGDADLILGCDLVVSGAKVVLASMRGAETGVVVNAAEVFPGDFTRNPDFSLPTERLKRSIEAASGGAARFVDATAAAVRRARQCDRRQHVHARLRLSVRLRAAVERRDPPRDRTQRRGGGDEPRRLRLGPRGLRRPRRVWRPS